MKKRIFIAVDISVEARRKASDYLETLRGEFQDLKVGWERAEKLHITLKFLGVTEAEKIAEVIKIGEKISAELEQFPIKIEQTGVFPNLKKVRILWLGLQDDTNSLKKIYDLLENECEKIGFRKEKRNFKPHLTIARIRQPEKSFELAKKHLENEFEPVGFEVSEIVIYESKLQPSGSVYFPVKRISI
jgi:2'-5' RNA ligase